MLKWKIRQLSIQSHREEGFVDIRVNGKFYGHIGKGHFYSAQKYNEEPFKFLCRCVLTWPEFRGDVEQRKKNMQTLQRIKALPKFL